MLLALSKAWPPGSKDTVLRSKSYVHISSGWDSPGNLLPVEKL